MNSAAQVTTGAANKDQIFNMSPSLLLFTAYHIQEIE
jgi:hypothetical protein